MEVAEPHAPADESGRLLVAHRSGDAQAFAKLVRNYRRPVYGYLVHCGVPEGERDDLFQDIFVRVHERAGTYDPSRPLHPWLFTVVANTVRSFFRKRQRRLYFFPLASVPSEDVKGDAPDGEALASASETKQWLERAIGALPLPQREVLTLAAIESLPLAEVASILGIPVNTVKTYLRRARLRLVSSYERRTKVTT
jgi:RNA polymerase sigma-70 factor (ECF subfamily)